MCFNWLTLLPLGRTQPNVGVATSAAAAQSVMLRELLVSIAPFSLKVTYNTIMKLARAALVASRQLTYDDAGTRTITHSLFASGCI